MSTVSSESRVSAAFSTARSEDRALLIGYLPAGYPSVTDSIDIMLAMIDNGVDLIEVGLPYSDPLMDGPVIQDAVSMALDHGATTDSVLEVVSAITAHGGTSVVMSYWNPIERYGVDRFAHQLSARGGSGLITPDLTIEEAQSWLDSAASYGLDPIFLVAPSSTDQRIAAIAGHTRGFIYAASTMGVTGARDQVSSDGSGTSSASPPAHGSAGRRWVGCLRQVTKRRPFRSTQTESLSALHSCVLLNPEAPRRWGNWRQNLPRVCEKPITRSAENSPMHPDVLSR